MVICHGYTHFLTQRKIKKYTKKNLLRLIIYEIVCQTSFTKHKVSNPETYMKEVDINKIHPTPTATEAGHLFSKTKAINYFYPKYFMELFLKLQAIRSFSHVKRVIFSLQRTNCFGEKFQVTYLLNKLTRKSLTTSVLPKQKFSLLSISKNES